MDVYLLSRCAVLHGSGFSSFTDLADLLHRSAELYPIRPHKWQSMYPTLITNTVAVTNTVVK
jgi:hypothetical protein